MSILIRASLALYPGCRLRYDCPPMGDSLEANKFFDTYRGRDALFVSYQEELIGALDYFGRMPGRYISGGYINVRFDGDTEVCAGLNTDHFVVCDSDENHVSLAHPTNTDPNTDQRLGDLPSPILFYYGDLVRFKKNFCTLLLDIPRPVTGDFLNKPFCTDGVPRYQVSETDNEFDERAARIRRERRSKKNSRNSITHIYQLYFDNVAGDDLELVSRGNVWALYAEPSKLSFESDRVESFFWAKDGISRRVAGSDAEERGSQMATVSSVLGRSIEDARRLFILGEVDVINPCGMFQPDARMRYTVFSLHPCFAQHRQRARALTERLWGKEPG